MPLNFLTTCFYWKFRKTWCLFKSCIALNPKSHCVNKFCFNYCFLFLLYLKLRNRNRHFLVCFCYWPNSLMKGDEGGIFSKAADWKTLFLLNIKIKQNPGCPNTEQKCSLHTLSSEYQIYLDQWLGYWEESGPMTANNCNCLTLQWIGRNLKVQPRLIFKKCNFSSFFWIGKNSEVKLEQHSKIQKSLC